MSKQIKVLLASVFTLCLAAPAFAQMNTITSIQEGRQNMADHSQSGDDNLTSTYQEGDENLGRVQQRGNINEVQAGQFGRGRNVIQADQRAR